MLCAVSGAVAGTTIAVTTTADELNADGDCSLREAVAAANYDIAVDACPAGNGGDVIDIPAGTYTVETRYAETRQRVGAFIAGARV